MVETSLGALLTAPSLAQHKILEACVPIPNNEYISLLGYRLGENLMSYPKVIKERVVDFVVGLRHLVDYVILDCAGVIEGDLFSLLAVEQADRVLKIGTPNLRGISYFRSHRGILSPADPSRCVSALGNFKTGQEWEAAAMQYGGVSVVFPYVAELEAQYDELCLFEELRSKDAGAFQKEMQKLMERLYDFAPPPQKSGKPVKSAPKQKRAFYNPFTGQKGEF
jgi:hypothetical protein